MDKLTQAFYILSFENKYLRLKGDAFQDFFSDIMEKGYPGDFQRTKPWGNMGDKKNDGYLKSQRKLFQVYAPDEMTAFKAIQKIDEDFSGAVKHWEAFFDTWVFVHNAIGGLGPQIVHRLLELEKENKPLRITNWGYEELRIEVAALDESQMASILGCAPTNHDLVNLRYSEIDKVLRAITDTAYYTTSEIKPVPPDKLKANQLSDAVQTLLKAGMSMTERVAQYFSQWHDPTYGDKVAQMFTSRYRELRDSNMEPDRIFQELVMYARGVEPYTPIREVAIYAVLAFLFEQCDIFERPRDT